jgi:hypothetical protein
MLTTKRVGLQHKTLSTPLSGRQKLNRVLDYLRPWYPLKFDFCRMTIGELTSMMDKVIREDQEDPRSYKSMVAIGHTKDLVDFETVESFLSYVKGKGIAISTFKEMYERCQNAVQDDGDSQRR